MQNNNWRKILRSILLFFSLFNLILLGLAMAVKSTIKYFFGVWISNFHALPSIVYQQATNRKIFYYQILRLPINHVTEPWVTRENFHYCSEKCVRAFLLLVLAFITLARWLLTYNFSIESFDFVKTHLKKWWTA